MPPQLLDGMGICAQIDATPGWHRKGPDDLGVPTQGVPGQIQLSEATAGAGKVQGQIRHLVLRCDAETD